MQKFLTAIALMLGGCANCQDQQCIRDLHEAKSKVANLTQSAQVCQNNLTQQNRDLDQITKQNNEANGQLQKNEERTKSRIAYFRQLAAQKVLINKDTRQQISKLSALISDKVKDEERAAIIENSLYWAIQIGREKWIRLFGYNPTNEQLLVINPAKSIFLYKKLGERMLSSKRIATEQDLIGMLDFNLGDGSGEIIMQISDDELERLSYLDNGKLR